MHFFKKKWFRIFAKISDFFKSFGLAKRYLRWIIYRAQTHGTVLESTRVELQNATTFMKKYSFALEISMLKSYKPKIVLNRRKSSSKSGGFLKLLHFFKILDSEFLQKDRIFSKVLDLQSDFWDESFIERKRTALF